MVFVEVWYLVFLALAALPIWLAGRSFGAWVLLAACFVFHWHYAGPAGMAPILVLSAVTFATLRWSRPDGSLGRSLLVLNVLLCVGALIAYRYTGKWAKPLAISFFTFEFIHLLADRLSGRLPKDLGLKDFLLFIFFFPSLAAGPIKRIESFRPQLSSVGWPGLEPFAWGVLRILFGLFKKLVLAQWFRALIPESTHLDTYDSTLLYGFFIYGFLYLDLSAYSDIAIGSARILGIGLPENVDWIPGVSAFSQYWSRWHISVTQWFKDYVFYPLARRFSHPVSVALAVVAALTLSGLWHGPHLSFVLWGLINGVALLAEIGLKRLLESRGWMRIWERQPWPVVRWIGFQWLLLVESVFFFYSLGDFSYLIGRSGVF